MPRPAWVLLAVAVVFEAAVVWAWIDSQDLEAQQAERPASMRYAALAVSALLPASLFLVGLWGRLDGFSMGALVLAVLIQTFIFWGWITSPQAEPARDFWIGSSLPLVLIVVTLLFHYLQREA